MNRFSIINNLQKQVNQLQEQVSFLEYYLKETVGMADMAPPSPYPTPSGPSKPSPYPRPTQPSYPYPSTPPNPVYRVGQAPGSQSGTFSPGGFHQSAKKRGMQGFRPSYSPGSQSSQQPPATNPPPVSTGRRRRS